MLAWLNQNRRRAQGLLCLGFTTLGLFFFHLLIPWIDLHHEPSRLDQKAFHLVAHISVGLDDSWRNWLTRYGRPARRDPRIVWIAIDPSATDPHLYEPEELKNPVVKAMTTDWPWRRLVHAATLEKLSQAGASIIGMDMMFPNPGRYPEDDAAFQKVLETHGDRLVIGMNFLQKANLQGDDFSGIWQLTPPSSTLIPGNNVADPRLGFVNFFPDLGGVNRSAIYQVYELEMQGFQRGEEDPLIYSLTGRMLQRAGQTAHLPVSPGQEFQLRFAGEPGTFPVVPIQELFLPKAWKDSYQSGEFFRNKIILIGPYGNALKDVVNTPYGEMQGPELHLNALNAALTGEFLQDLPPLFGILNLLLGGIGAWFVCVCVRRPWLRLLLVILSLSLHITLVFQLFSLGWILLPFPSHFVFFSIVSINILGEYTLDLMEKGRTRRMLERYVSKNVVKEVLDNPKTVMTSLGGVRRNAAILFSDVRNFTTMTEGRDSRELVLHLNEYFEEMVGIVFKYNGTLDKFIGDAVMAVWGNIVSEGPAKDCAHAIQAALDMRSSLIRLNQVWPTKGYPTLAFGIGINFGEVVVGELGSSQKKEFTAIGDAVNTASRLEGMTKEYGVEILVGEEAAVLTEDLFHYQTCDYVIPKGKTVPAIVYTVHGIKSEPLPPSLARYLQSYEEGFQLYLKMKFFEAMAKFSEADSHRPGDFLCRMYLERCRSYLETPPPADWNGAYKMTKK
jgi:adenylate cyclase